MKKILVLFALLVLCATNVFAYGGGSSFIYANPTITNNGDKLHHFELNRGSNFNFNAKNSDMIQKVQLSFDTSTNSKYVDVYEVNKNGVYEGMNPYKIISIKTDTENLREATISFKVPKTFADKSEIKVLHVRDDGSSEYADINLIKEDNQYYYYELVTNSFSEFIVGTEAPEVEIIEQPKEGGLGDITGGAITETGEEENNEITGMATGEKRVSPTKGITIVIVIVIVGMVFYFVFKKKRKK